MRGGERLWGPSGAMYLPQVGRSCAGFLDVAQVATTKVDPPIREVVGWLFGLLAGGRMESYFYVL